jgi:hypothetical protein
VVEYTPVGSVSGNGVVLQLKNDNDGYISYTVLKSTKTKAKGIADNLMYEYMVGKEFINDISDKFPCFVETYHLMKYTNDFCYDMIVKHKNYSKINTCLKPVPESHNTDVGFGCQYSGKLALLIQHIGDSITLHQFINNTGPRIIDDELILILYQVYMPLMYIRDIYTHYDLHTENVLLYKPYADKKIHYRYHLPNNEVVEFYSSYIVKIIDYGRSFYEGNDFIYGELCNEVKCRPNCGESFGFKWLAPVVNVNHYITSSMPNKSHDLRLLAVMRQYDSVILSTFSEMDDIFSMLRYNTEFGTPARNSEHGKINNVIDAHNILKGFIMGRSLKAMSSSDIAGTMNVYADGSPLEYISSAAATTSVAVASAVKSRSPPLSAKSWSAGRRSRRRRRRI